MEQLDLYSEAAFSSVHKGAADADEYLKFIKKFEDKRTTDDCYTPPRVYQVVFDYVDEFILPLGDKKVVRPFFPGGDYQKDADSYDDHTVVIDNPPFSIITEVCRFYVDRSIKFFLFSPHLTAFNMRPTKHSIIITNADVVYENGAKIKTAFTTNLLGDVLIKVAPELARRIKAAQEAEEKECLPKYVYPSNLVTVSSISRLVNSGVEFEVMRSEAHFVHSLDDQRAHKKKIFGGGFLVSDSVVNSINSIEKLNPAKCEYVWRLSERERNLISCLSDAREKLESDAWDFLRSKL